MGTMGMSDNQYVNALIDLLKKRKMLIDELCDYFGFTNRIMRLLIKQASKDAPIINLQDGKGYFIPKDQETIKRYIIQEVHRAKKIYQNVNNLRKFVEK